MEANKLTGKVAVVTGASKESAPPSLNHSPRSAHPSSLIMLGQGWRGQDRRRNFQGWRQTRLRRAVTSQTCRRAEIIDAAIKSYGRLDILVNNSGVYEFGGDRGHHSGIVPPDV